MAAEPEAGSTAGAPVPVDAIVGALGRAGLLLSTSGALPAFVTGVTDDSRRVTLGALFIAVAGADDDGHRYLPAAAAAGAGLALVTRADSTTLPALVVRDGRRAAAVAAAAYYGEPASRLALVGVTGTNGKTTTVAMLRHLLDAPGAPAASVGTLGVLVGSAGEPFGGGSGLTTPGPVELQRVLRGLADAGVRAVAMEVSSHALEQRRTEGVEFAAAVFTNFTRDHLDYHGTMAAYFAAKARLVEALAPGGAAVVNADDPAWEALPPAARTVRWGVASDADAARARGLDVAALAPAADGGGTRFTLQVGGDAHATRVPLLGDYNVANALGAAAAAWTLGVAPAVCADRLATLPQVPGRLERLRTRPTVLRDYAHTPDSLTRALAAVRPFARGRVIVVFGAGGDRDRGKRPEMARAAEAGADVVVITSDNPRTEDPERILDDVAAGLTRAHERIEDRRSAIARALGIAGPDDVVLLAGKGHETYQIRGTTTLPFDEAAIVDELSAASTADAPGAPDAFWTLDRVADALADVCSTDAPRGGGALRAVATDTRAIAPGDLFVALAGERYDAHDFLADAVGRGAAALVVHDASRAGGLDVPVYVVRDTREALGRLARYRRRAWARPGRAVVGVAGSNGKTSTKELLRAALGAARPVHATTGNLNNLIGVPLTLLALPDAAELAVVEMGTNAPGEIAALRAIVEPDLVVMTSIGEEHLEGLGDLAGVLREESDAFDGAALAIVPADQPEIAAAARGRARAVVTAGLDVGDVRAERWALSPDGTGVLVLDGVEVRTPVRGAHNLRNAMLALATARALGVPVADAARGLAAMPVPSMRTAWTTLGSATLINDAYNANPPSARAALDLLAAAGRSGAAGDGAPARQRVAVLGTMRELGASAPALHDAVARYALALEIDVVAGVGDFAESLARVAPGDARVVTAADPAALWPHLEARLAPDAVILLKGSRGVRLEQLVPSLEAWAIAGATRA